MVPPRSTSITGNCCVEHVAGHYDVRAAEEDEGVAVGVGGLVQH
jgi:hypothetical protein